MARVQFSAPIEEILGKLAGSVFQDSYIGIQIRTKVTPTNRLTPRETLRRGMFGFITQTFRFLTASELLSYQANAPTGMSAFAFFVSCSINLSLINQPLQKTFTPGALPVAFPVTITQLSTTTFGITATTSPTVVPAGFTLLVYVTATKAPTKIFTNPSQYQPITSFPAGSNMAIEQSIFTAYVQHYGPYKVQTRLCLKTALINASNGIRIDSPPTCLIVLPLVTNYIIDLTGDFLIDADGTFISFP